MTLPVGAPKSCLSAPSHICFKFPIRLLPYLLREPGGSDDSLNTHLDDDLLLRKPLILTPFPNRPEFGYKNFLFP